MKGILLVLSVLIAAPAFAREAKPTPPQGTLDQQKLCADQSERVAEQYKKNPLVNPADVSFTSHYDATASVCYVEITNEHYFNASETDDHKEHAIKNAFIRDAFGGRELGEFVSPVFNSNEPQLCNVHPSGHPEITCKSNKEFDDLTLKYFGTE
jgi:hypothetical protein